MTKDCSLSPSPSDHSVQNKILGPKYAFHGAKDQTLLVTDPTVSWHPRKPELAYPMWPRHGCWSPLGLSAWTTPTISETRSTSCSRKPVGQRGWRGVGVGTLSAFPPCQSHPTPSEDTLHRPLSEQNVLLIDHKNNTSQTIDVEHQNSEGKWRQDWHPPLCLPRSQWYTPGPYSHPLKNHDEKGLSMNWSGFYQQYPKDR